MMLLPGVLAGALSITSSRDVRPWPQGSENLFLKSGFWGFYWVWGFIGFSDFLFEHAVAKLVGCISAKIRQYFRLSKNSHIHYLLLVRSCNRPRNRRR